MAFVYQSALHVARVWRAGGQLPSPARFSIRPGEGKEGPDTEPELLGNAKKFDPPQNSRSPLRWVPLTQKLLRRTSTVRHNGVTVSADLDTWGISPLFKQRRDIFTGHGKPVPLFRKAIGALRRLLAQRYVLKVGHRRLWIVP